MKRLAVIVALLCGPHLVDHGVERAALRRPNAASANQLDDADNRIFRPATDSGMRDPLAPQLGRPTASDAVVGHGVRRVARMVRFSSVLFSAVTRSRSRATPTIRGISKTRKSRSRRGSRSFAGQAVDLGVVCGLRGAGADELLPEERRAEIRDAGGGGRVSRRLQEPAAVDRQHLRRDGREPADLQVQPGLVFLRAVRGRHDGAVGDGCIAGASAPTAR